jgi:hypothetical protein
MVIGRIIIRKITVIRTIATPQSPLNPYRAVTAENIQFLNISQKPKVPPVKIETITPGHILRSSMDGNGRLSLLPASHLYPTHGAG